MSTVIFIDPDGRETTVNAADGDTVLTTAHTAGIDMEGACEGSMACSTCHVIVATDWAARLPPPSDYEADMLDLTWGVEATSRLGCQIRLGPETDGLRLRLPAKTSNMLL